MIAYIDVSMWRVHMHQKGVYVDQFPSCILEVNRYEAYLVYCCCYGMCFVNQGVKIDRIIRI